MLDSKPYKSYPSPTLNTTYNYISSFTLFVFPTEIQGYFLLIDYYGNGIVHDSYCYNLDIFILHYLF